MSLYFSGAHLKYPLCWTFILREVKETLYSTMLLVQQIIRNNFQNCEPYEFYLYHNV